MAQYPKQIKAQTELQEKTTECDLSRVHLTTTNFGDFGVAAYRNNTPRETTEIDISVFARPFPIQMPVMASAEHHLKTFYVPYRVICPQWNAFINKSPYVPMNSPSVIQVAEMPYFTTLDMYNFITNPLITQPFPGGIPDFKINGTDAKLTSFGRYCVKTLQQLGYDIIWDSKGEEHIDAKAILAYAKVFCDFYYNSAYYNSTAEFLAIEQLFKKDAITAYHVSDADLISIFDFCKKVFYSESLIVSAWDNPTSPNSWNDTAEISLIDLTLTTNPSIAGFPNHAKINNGDINGNGTPRITLPGQQITAGVQAYQLTQYAIDALKKMNDYCVRFAMAGNREVDRYLARFGVLLSAEKMKRSIYYGEQITKMEFGAVYSTASTTGANVGDYAGQSIINSDGQEHKHWTIESDEYGIILCIGTIVPKVNYFQGIDRNNLVHEVETYFNGIFDQLGTSGISQSEILVSTDDSFPALQGDTVIRANYGWLPRGYQYKIPRDFLTGDFRHGSLYDVMAAWHLFRKFNATDFPTGITHSPDITRMIDSDQYHRIFDNTKEEDGDHFHIIYQISEKARIHAKPLYDNYDFESEGKEIMLQGNGPKEN